jgi:site-specific DNA-cytosine methylase
VFGVSSTDVDDGYKMIGNAVPVSLASAIGSSILKTFNSTLDKTNYTK